MPKKKTSAIQEKAGTSIPETVNTASIKSLKEKRKKAINIETLVNAILKQNIAALSQAITLIESENAAHHEKSKNIINACLPHANKSIRIGITGIPGVGKSTFIEALGTHLTSLGKRVAVLAIDPSSSLSHGSILGDKTQMENLVKNEQAFIRPTPSGTTLGGVARKTRESIILCEAAGFDIIIIETVGVGQSETTVHSMVDFFLLLKLANTGDALQGIKRGIIEMADAIVINKADGINLKAAKLAKTQFTNALDLYPKKPSHWKPVVALCSAKQNSGIDTIWNIMVNYIETTTKNNFFIEKRREQNKLWLIQTIEEKLKTDFFNKPKIKHALAKQLELIKNHKTTPFAAAEFLLKINA